AKETTLDGLNRTSMTREFSAGGTQNIYQAQTYNRLGKIAATWSPGTAPNGTAPGNLTQYWYDDLGRLSEVWREGTLGQKDGWFAQANVYMLVDVNTALDGREAAETYEYHCNSAGGGCDDFSGGDEIRWQRSDSLGRVRASGSLNPKSAATDGLCTSNG